MKLPEIFSKLKSPKVLQGSPKKEKRPQLIKIWKKFLRQIPREFRSVTKSHKHFVLLGDSKSGKSELVKNLLEQSQNIYPFEVEFTDDEGLQLYLGPKQIIQELSLDLMKDRTIKLRRSMIQLWKRLFVKGAPVVVIAYNCFLESSQDIREVNKSARLISGKLSLLSELSKAPLNVRIALTHLDKVEGYLEFAHFIKQHNIAFKIPLTSNFESEALSEALSSFRDKYLSLILTSTSASEYTKILRFFSEFPKLFQSVEEFLRVLTTGNAKNKIQLESLTFTSNFEPYTSYASFDWTPTGSRSIFYRHPMLKHQVAAAAILLVSFGLVFNNFFKDRHQISLSKEGIDSLIYLQPKFFIDEVIPEIERVNQFRPQEGYLPVLPRFYKKELRETNQALAYRIRKHILEPNLRRWMLQRHAEIKVIYMLGLIHATHDNRLGKHITKNAHDWARMLELDQRLISAYVQSNYHLDNTSMEIDYLDKINVSTPLSDSAPWLKFLTHFQELSTQPVFTGHNFEDLRLEARTLLNQLLTLKRDAHAFVISNLLRETSSQILSDFSRNIKLLKWIEDNHDQLDTFLTFVYQSSPEIPDVGDLNVSQFFARLKEIGEMTKREPQSFPFILENKEFTFETEKWIHLAASHMTQRLINNYIVANNGTQGEIFFRHTAPMSNLEFQSYHNEFPYFPEPIVVDGRYTRLAFEKKVRNTTESLLKLLEEMPLNDEDKDRFTKFMQQELISYANNYQDAYERLYAACDIRTSTLEETKEILIKILSPGSYFEQFLNTVNHHTEVFSDPTSCLSALDEMNHFYFLQPLMAQVKSKQSPFQGYQKLIATALKQLNFEIPYASEVDKHLTPAAAIALSILRDAPEAYTNQIKESLFELGVPKDYHSIFLAPIEQIYTIGVKDLKKGIHQLWNNSLYPKMQCLFNKRPFNPDGIMAATFEEVEAITSPTHAFFTTIKEIVTPISLSAQGFWIPNPASDLQLSKEMYTSLNRLAKVSTTLWDSEGNPKPIELRIQSRPFESEQKAFPAPIVSYLVTGEETFHNFNQTPSWHQIKIDWWKESSSTVVVELVNKNDSRSYRDEKVTNTLWSFFELLGKGHEKKQNIWLWEAKGQSSDEASKVALQFETNPWELFQNCK